MGDITQKLIDIVQYQNEKIKEIEERMKNFTEVMTLRLINDFIDRTKEFTTHCKHHDDIGCGSKFFFQYFMGKMSGSSMVYHDTRTWKLDFVIPLKYFDLTNKEEWRCAIHYTNLIPIGIDKREEKRIVSEEELTEFFYKVQERRKHDKKKLIEYGKNKEKHNKDDWMNKSFQSY
jgi:hypothetical protein